MQVEKLSLRPSAEEQLALDLAGGYPTERRRRKRSSCDSGSGYVPACSWGFWVASTMNGSGRRRGAPSTETWASAIASSRQLCVRGVVRLISSARTRFANSGPGLKTKLFRA